METTGVSVMVAVGVSLGVAVSVAVGVSLAVIVAVRVAVGVLVCKGSGVSVVVLVRVAAGKGLTPATVGRLQANKLMARHTTSSMPRIFPRLGSFLCPSWSMIIALLQAVIQKV